MATKPHFDSLIDGEGEDEMLLEIEADGLKEIDADILFDILALGD